MKLKAILVRFTNWLFYRQKNCKIFKNRSTPLPSRKDDIVSANSALSGFKGTDEYHYFPLTGSYFTDGIKALIEKYDCLWLVSDILFNANKAPYRNEPFHVWKLERVINRKRSGRIIERQSSFFLSCEDGNYNKVTEPIYYVYCHFKPDTVELWFRDNVLYLPSES